MWFAVLARRMLPRSFNRSLYRYLTTSPTIIYSSLTLSLPRYLTSDNQFIAHSIAASLDCDNLFIAHSIAASLVQSLTLSPPQ